MVVRKIIWRCGEGAIVKEELCEKVVEVRSVSDRVMILVVFEEDVLRLICWYAPQSRSLEGKQSFYVELNVSGICILQMIWLCAWVT